MRNAVFCIAKGNLSGCKRWSFRGQKTTFCNALNINTLQRRIKSGLYYRKTTTHTNLKRTARTVFICDAFLPRKHLCDKD